MGVEPTKDRLAAPPGFEVRTPHRGRLSSSLNFQWLSLACPRTKVDNATRLPPRGLRLSDFDLAGQGRIDGFRGLAAILVEQVRIEPQGDGREAWPRRFEIRTTSFLRRHPAKFAGQALQSVKLG